mmetsp:Transcript_120006/g.350760  ORF Transcript_120006/g.350760 Transcript_120006/m.350760 type:complete len:364 (+) Transcript_120006:3-1094(+)
MYSSMNMDPDHLQTCGTGAASVLGRGKCWLVCMHCACNQPSLNPVFQEYVPMKKRAGMQRGFRKRHLARPITCHNASNDQSCCLLSSKAFRQLCLETIGIRALPTCQQRPTAMEDEEGRRNLDAQLLCELHGTYGAIPHELHETYARVLLCKPTELRLKAAAGSAEGESDLQEHQVSEARRRLRGQQLPPGAGAREPHHARGAELPVPPGHEAAEGDVPVARDANLTGQSVKVAVDAKHLQPLLQVRKINMTPAVQVDLLKNQSKLSLRERVQRGSAAAQDLLQGLRDLDRLQLHDGAEGYAPDHRALALRLGGDLAAPARGQRPHFRKPGHQDRGQIHRSRSAASGQQNDAVQRGNSRDDVA